ncbi:MAG: MG2 domain-containing protein, partial [Syntrophales bacterium]|nr:MG2 domain-containing protein [Syntrophales bacterium]
LSVEGLKEQVGVRVVKGKEREKILAALSFTRPKEPGDACKGKTCYMVSGEIVVSDRIVLLQGKQQFPASAEIRLVWGAGIVSEGGVATTEDQGLSFRTRPPFVATFQCSREKADAACIPVLPMGIYFSAPIPVKTAAQIALKSRSGRQYKGKFTGDDEDDKKFIQRVVFAGPFPEKTAFTLTVPHNIKDDAGRPLENMNQFPLAVATNTYPPLAKFSSRFGIIESVGDRLLPVTVRNIETDLKNRLRRIEDDVDSERSAAAPGKIGNVADQAAVKSADQAGSRFVQRLSAKVRRVSLDREEGVIDWLKRVAAAERTKSVFKGGEGKSLTVPKPGGGKAFEVVGIPLREPGFYVVEMESAIMGRQLLDPPGPMYIPTSALVTNLSAHFKWGRESSMIWVTSLDRGQPVRGAAVSIRDCLGKVIWQGKTDKQGVAMIRKALPETPPSCKGEVNYGEAAPALTAINQGLFIFARQKDDLTFTHTSWSMGIEPWRFQLPQGEDADRGPVIAHTVLDRSLLRAGETVHMKHVLRVHTASGFDLLRGGKVPDEVAIEHRGSGTQYRLPLAWRNPGLAESEWKIPEGAKLGTYAINLEKKEVPSGKDRGHQVHRQKYSWESGSFRVEEFRIPLMKGIIQPLKGPLVKVKEVGLDLSVSYLSGGGAAELPVTLRAETRDRIVSFPGYDGFSFGSGRLAESLT